MLISDWSSDVCSSDLACLFKRARIGRGQEQRAAARSDRGLSHWPETRGPRADAALRPDRPPALWAHPKSPPRSPDRGRDRKSVVWGKSVSVRVDLGGRRIIKKKKKI